jgi:NitT/TauT family transport system permease protein
MPAPVTDPIAGRLTSVAAESDVGRPALCPLSNKYRHSLEVNDRKNDRSISALTRTYGRLQAVALLDKQGVVTAIRGILAISFVLALWWAGTYYRIDGIIRFVNIPRPAVVFEALLTLIATRVYWIHILFSVERVILGFVLATVLAVPLGLSCAMVRSIREFVLPVVEVFRPVPAIAWVPISMMLWPTSEGSILFITMLGAFFPVFINTFRGAQAIDKTYTNAALSLGATYREVILDVMVPGALPQIFTGLTLGVGMSWVSVIAAEMISGQFGIGYFTWEAYSLLQYPRIVVGMLSIGVLGLTFSALIRALGKIAAPWTHRDQ